jgi:4-hydroxy-2-oxoglutarate aldolase
MLDLKGIFAPATTPFDRVTGDLDVVALRSNVRSLLETPVAGLVLFGTTGEGPLVDDEERIAAIAGVRELSLDRLLLVGAGAESTRAVIQRARAAADLGVDAVLVSPPSFFAPQMTPEALREHFRAVADESPIPVLLYQVPTAYAGVPLAAGLVAELANHRNVVGMKDSSGDLKTLGSLIDAAPRDFALLVGSGAVLYAALELGVTGAVLAVADLVPDRCCSLYRAFRGARLAEAGRIQEALTPIHKEVVARYGVAGVKAALDLLGHAGGPTRPPLRPLPERDRERVREVLASAGLLP